MARIIPAILTEEAETFKERVNLVAPFVDLVQVDVLNGTFVPEFSFSDPEAIAALHLPTAFEVHLMVNNPENFISDWVRIGAARIIIHVESKGNIGLAIERVKQYNNRKAGLAFNPDTEIRAFHDLLDIVDFVQLMGVTPGAMGREFNETVFDKIAYIKKEKPELNIAIDGGVSEKNILQLVQAGAVDFGVGSAIFLAKNPIEALKNLQNLVSAS